MSMQPRPWPRVPEQTTAVTRAAFPKGTLAIRVRDELPELFADEQFVAAFGVRGRPGISPGQLALVTVLQFAENPTDRQAADAVRARIDRPGSRSAARLRPAPGRRIRPSGSAPPSNSSTPSDTVAARTPVARATAQIPPCPSDRAFCRGPRVRLPAGDGLYPHRRRLPVVGGQLAPLLPTAGVSVLSAQGSAGSGASRRKTRKKSL